MNYIKKILKTEMFWNIILIFSAICFNTVLAVNSTSKIIILLGWIVIAFVMGYILFHKKMLQKIIKWEPVFNKKLDLFIIIFLSVWSSQLLLQFFVNQSSFFERFTLQIATKLSTSFDKLWLLEINALFLLAIPFICLLWGLVIHYCIPKVLCFYRSLSKIEKKYFYVSNIVIAIVSFFIVTQTSVFTAPIAKEKTTIEWYDVLYTTDNGVQMIYNSFANFNAPENDLRQPLFALAAFPFAVASDIGATMFGYLSHSFAYSYFLICFQGLVLVVCSILLSRMLTKKNTLFSLLFFSCMYATIFFICNIEQYVFGIFWLILLIYYFVQEKKSNPFLFSITAGALLTNVVLLPFLVFKKNWKHFIKEGIKYGLFFCFLLILFGQASSVINGLIGFQRYQGFMGESVGFQAKLYQYFNFIAGCFVGPKSEIVTLDGHFSYRLQQVSGINILGLILLIAMIISFVLNHKKKIAQVSFGWFLFSFIILTIIGWGTAENGLIIYGIYFSWAYFALIYLLLDGILEKVPRAKIFVWSLLFIIMIILNAKEFISIIEFGKQYYPFKFR